MTATTRPGVVLEMQFSGSAGAWTDIAADVLTQPGIRARYGIFGTDARARAELHQARRARDEAERRAEHFESLAGEGKTIVEGMMRDRQRTEKILAAVGGRGGVSPEVMAELRQDREQFAGLMTAIVDRLNQPQPAPIVRTLLEVPPGGLPIALPVLAEEMDIQRDQNGVMQGGRKIIKTVEPA